MKKHYEKKFSQNSVHSSKTLQDFSVSDRQPLWKVATHQSTPKDGNIATVQKQSSARAVPKTLKNNLQLQLCHNPFATYCQLDQILDRIEASGVTPKSLLFT